MDLEKLKEYLENKESKNRLERMALQALLDEEFISEYGDFYYFNHMTQLRNVMNNPTEYDAGDQNRRSLYIMTLKEISNNYGTYLEDEKTNYSGLKEEISSLEERLRNAGNKIENINEVSKIISGAKVLDSYAEEFENRSKNYETESRKWKKNLYWAFGWSGLIFISFIFFSIINLDNFKSEHVSEEIIKFGYISVVAIKIIILVVLIQLIRFFHRNYNANKHLANQSLHKCDVLRSLQGVYNTINVENKEARDELIKTGALIAFQNIESGYITTKEGAGNSDSGTLSFLSELFKR